MTPPPKDLTDTGEKLAAVAEDAAERALAKSARAHDKEERLSRTPPMGTPGPHESSEAIEALQWQRCYNCGPASRLGKKIDDIEEEMARMKLERAEEKGAAREIAREAGKAGALRMALVSAGLSLAVGLGLFVLNRTFPAAHAQPAQVQGAQR